MPFTKIKVPGHAQRPAGGDHPPEQLLDFISGAARSRCPRGRGGNASGTWPAGCIPTARSCPQTKHGSGWISGGWPPGIARGKGPGGAASLRGHRNH